MKYTKITSYQSDNSGNAAFLFLLLLLFLSVLANQLKGTLLPLTDLECGVNIDLVERKLYLRLKKNLNS